MIHGPVNLRKLGHYIEVGSSIHWLLCGGWAVRARVSAQLLPQLSHAHIFLLFQESVTNAQAESTDFGLNISKIHKDNPEEKAHPRRVSRARVLGEKGGLFLEKENKAHDFVKHESEDRSIKDWLGEELTGTSHEEQNRRF